MHTERRASAGDAASEGPDPSASFGPVSAALLRDLREQVRRYGVVVWLDIHGDYAEFVDALAAARAAGSVPFATYAFRGSHLELILSLGHAASGVTPPHLLLHLPGFNEDTVRKSPVLELYRAGKRYRKKLATLTTEAAAGQVPPDQIQAFVAKGVPSLAIADAWLSAQLDRGGEGLSAQLRQLAPRAVIDELLAGGPLAHQVDLCLADSVKADGLWHALAARTGLTRAWGERVLPPTPVRSADVAFALASWALAVEYVLDLRRSPVDPVLSGIGALPAAVGEANQALAAELRALAPTFYQRTADETERWIADEIQAARAEDLGRIDTFRFEADHILGAAIDALRDESWEAPLAWAEHRITHNSFWLRQDASRQAAWQLVRHAAVLGRALTRAGPSLGARTFDAASTRYIAAGAPVDRAHRHMEQARAALLFPQVPAFESLRDALDTLRERWRDWADHWSRDFHALCRDQGFLPPPALQQRNLFDDVVRPSTQESGITALFMVDALRFEMGQELLEAIDGTPATTAHLQARFAELPTITAVGMNVLAPVVRGGRLAPKVSQGKFKGFSTGEFHVASPDDRNRAMWDRVGGNTCPWLTLEEVVTRPTTSLKQSVARARLVVVHSIEIDAAGEKGVGPSVFNDVMQKLRAAWRLLREAGVRRFVFTSDHGFLLLDKTAHRAVPHGRKIDPKRRHVISEVPADHDNEVRVPLADLGYDGTAGLHLMFPASTAVFDTGKKLQSFVHGGNSLQERLIPVLTVVHRSPAGGDGLRYHLTASALEDVANMHCLTGTLDVDLDAHLPFGGARVLELALRVVKHPDAQVELCQVRGGAQLTSGGWQAQVGEPFELFFRLSGPRDARARVEIYHPASAVEPVALETHFTVAGTNLPRDAAPDPAQATPADASWLAAFEGGVRQFFQHLSDHGIVSEADAARLLGSPRAARSFARQFDAYAARVPFEIRIETVGGTKRYIREGS